MEMLMLTVAWGNQEEHTVRSVQTMPLIMCKHTDTRFVVSHPMPGYGETIAMVVPGADNEAAQ